MRWLVRIIVVFSYGGFGAACVPALPSSSGGVDTGRSPDVDGGFADASSPEDSSDSGALLDAGDLSVDSGETPSCRAPAARAWSFEEIYPGGVASADPSLLSYFSFETDFGDEADGAARVRSRYQVSGSIEQLVAPSLGSEAAIGAQSLDLKGACAAWDLCSGEDPREIDSLLEREASAFNADQFTAAAWVYIRSTPPSAEVSGVIKGPSGHGFGRGFRIVVGGGNAQAFWADSGGIKDAVAEVELNRWVHVALRVSASEGELFIDGVSRARDVREGSLVYGQDVPDIWLGKASGTGSLDGLIDEAAIWERALSDEELSALAAKAPIAQDFGGHTARLRGAARHFTDEDGFVRVNESAAQDYVEVSPTMLPVDARTVVAVRLRTPTSISGPTVLLSQVSGFQQQMFLAVADGSLRIADQDPLPPGSLYFRLEDGGRSLFATSSTIAWEGDRWYQIVVEIAHGNAQETRIWVDGVDMTTDRSGPVFGDTPVELPLAPLRVGAPAPSLNLNGSFPLPFSGDLGALWFLEPNATETEISTWNGLCRGGAP